MISRRRARSVRCFVRLRVYLHAAFLYTDYLLVFFKGGSTIWLWSTFFSAANFSINSNFFRLVINRQIKFSVIIVKFGSDAI